MLDGGCLGQPLPVDGDAGVGDLDEFVDGGHDNPLVHPGQGGVLVELVCHGPQQVERAEGVLPVHGGDLLEGFVLDVLVDHVLVVLEAEPALAARLQALGGGDVVGVEEVLHGHGVVLELGLDVEPLTQGHAVEASVVHDPGGVL